MSSLAVTTGRAAFVALSPLFEWPDAAFDAHAARAAGDVEQSDGRAARRFHEFVVAMRDLDPAQREITYTSTFDLAPSCSPYLGFHLFGDQNRQRARLMDGLRSVAAAAGKPASAELPDHLAVVLALAPHFDDQEWPELLTLVLEPALRKMEQSLQASRNPYRHLVSATRHLVQAAAGEGGES